VAEIHNVRSSVNFTERIFSATLPCATVNSGKKTKNVHLLQVYKLYKLYKYIIYYYIYYMNYINMHISI